MSNALRQQLCALLGDPGAADGQRPEAATLLLPDGDGPHPAVLYCHAHGGDYTLGRRELAEGARWLSAPYGPDLVRAGFAVLCADMPGFGDRQSEGSESALSKAGAWFGRPLFGQMVHAQLNALRWLRRDRRIDAARIAVVGTSMGAALAMWVAALDREVRACVQLCMLANLGPLIETGAHDRHGTYLTVPGLLRVAEVGQVAALIAPRAQFVGLSAHDAFTPPAARDPALATLRAAYAGAEDRLCVHVSPDSGHEETPLMRQAVLSFLKSSVLNSDERTPQTC